jgi:hypothetical protein
MPRNFVAAGAGNVMFLKSGRKTISGKPRWIIYGENLAPIIESDVFHFVTVTDAAWKPENVWKGDIFRGARAAGEKDDPILMQEVISSLGKNIRHEVIIGRERLYQKMTTDCVMSRKKFNGVFSVPDDWFEESRDASEIVILFPDQTMPKRRQMVIDAVKAVQNRFLKAGLGYMVPSHVILSRLREGVQGIYSVDSKDIRLARSALKNAATLERVLTHEFFHHHFYAHLTQDQRDLVAAKFNSLECHRVMIKKPLRDAFTKLKIGQPVYYHGGKADYPNEWHITSLDNGHAVEIEDLTNHIQLAHSAESFVALGFRFPEMESILASMPVVLSVDLKAEPTSNWFPTQYSMIGEYEWYPESMTMLVFDLLSGDVKDFFSQFITG